MRARAKVDRGRRWLRLLVFGALMVVGAAVGCSGGPASSSPSLSPTAQVTPSPGPTSTPTVAPSPRPASGTFTATGSMTFPDGGAPYLESDGRVLVLGLAYGKADVYDPGSGSFTSTPAPDVAGGGLSVSLQDGRVLILDPAGHAYLYDIATGKVSPKGSMVTDRIDYSAVRMADGRVLITGGTDRSYEHYLASAEIYDPATGSFTATGSMRTARENQSATLLPDGRVLIAGGDQGSGGPDQVVLSSAETYDPKSGTFSPTGSLQVPRTNAPAALLKDGQVLIAGGIGPNTQVLATAELYDPTTGKFSATGSMAAPRMDFTTTVLLDGRAPCGWGR